MGFTPGAAFDTPFRPGADSSGEFEVKDILDHRLTRSSMLYLVKWRGYPVAEASWEPLTQLLQIAVLFFWLIRDVGAYVHPSGGSDVRFWLSSCGFLLGCCFVLLCKHGALQRQSLEPSRAKCVKWKTLPKQSESAKQSPRMLVCALKLVDTCTPYIYVDTYIYIYMCVCVCMCCEEVCGRTGRVLMD